MNYMEQVAQMLGIKIGEEFRIVNDPCLYKLDDKGLYFLENDDKWKIDYLTLTKIMNGKEMIIKKPILDEAEREYLSNIIKPFRDRVVSIVKYDDYDRCECIVIKYRNINGYTGRMYFPAFEKDTMYKGMKANKKYTLEDMGL